MRRRLVAILASGALLMAPSVVGPALQGASAAETPRATPTPDVVRVESREGMSTAALIALVLVAGAVGGVAARLAARRLPRRRPSGAAPSTNAATAIPQPVPSARAPRPGDPPRPPATPATRPADPPRPPATPATRPADPPRPPATRPADPPRPPATPASGAGTPNESPEPRERAPAARSRVRRPRSEPTPAGAPDPPRARRFEPAGAPWEGCAIKLQTRDAHGRFCAIAEGEPRVLAYSPTFPLNRAERAPGPQAPAALKALVEELAASGWRQAGKGPRPWDLRFRRAVGADRSTGR